MTLEERITQDLKTAMKAKDQAALRGIRAIKAALLLVKTEAGSTGDVSGEREIQILQKLVKQRQESLHIYEEQDRPDLAQTEREEIDIIQRYLPEQMSEAELETTLRNIIDTTGASSMRDMGRVMGVAGQQLAGRADGKTIAAMVKRLLG